MNNRDIYEKAKNKWGYKSQINMCIEEMSELIQAFMKADRKYKEYDTFYSRVDAIREEIADVEIMIEQMKLIFDEHKIEEIKSKKLMRLMKKLNE